MPSPETCIFLSDNEFCSLGLFDGKPRAGDCLGCNKRVPITIENGARAFKSVDVHTYLEALNTCVTEEFDIELAKHGAKALPETEPPDESPGPSRGFGDTVAKLTSKAGIKPCGGCKKRQALLNKMMPYNKPEKETNADHSQSDPPDDSTQTS